MENQECECCSAESKDARNDAIVFASQLLMGAARDLLERVELDYNLPRSGVYSRVNRARTWLREASLMLDSIETAGYSGEVMEE